MNPVKSVQSIKDSYFNFGVKDFALDCKDELKKIVKATKGAKDLNLHIRISTNNIYSKVNLSKKFGIDGEDADILLKDSMQYSKNLGISFHVGSQCMSPNAYADSINKVCSILKKSKVKIKYFNIGGGFQVSIKD